MKTQIRWAHNCQLCGSEIRQGKCSNEDRVSVENNLRFDLLSWIHPILSITEYPTVSVDGLIIVHCTLRKHAHAIYSNISRL